MQWVVDPEAFARVSVVGGGGGIERAAGPDRSCNSVYFSGEPASA